MELGPLIPKIQPSSMTIHQIQVNAKTLKLTRPIPKASTVLGMSKMETIIIAMNMMEETSLQERCAVLVEVAQPMDLIQMSQLTQLVEKENLAITNQIVLKD